MSNTIQTRHYTARQATLLQRRPGDLIEVAEKAALALESAYSHTVQVLYHRGIVHSANVNVVGAGGAGRSLEHVLTAGSPVLLVSTAWPTTSPELLVDLDEHQAVNGWTRWAGQAKDALQKAASTARRQTTATARWRVDRLSALQAAFGFTIQDLAGVLSIARPQLYKWLDSANEIKLQDASLARLAMVERIAKEWTSRSTAPLGPLSKEPLAAGGNVFTLVSAESIDEAAVIGAFDELIAKLQERPKSRSQRLREAGFTRRPSVRSLPSDE